MTYKTGKDFFINRIAASTQYSLGGIPISTPTVSIRVSEVSEAGTGQRRLALLPKAADVAIQVEFTLALQILASYIEAHCMKTAEGALAVHDLIYEDGVEDALLDDCLVDRCEITIPHSGSVKAAIRAFATDHDPSQTYSSDVRDTEAVMTKKNLTTFSVGGTNLLDKFSGDITFGVNNNVENIHLGTLIRPTQIAVREATYFGRLAIGISGASEFEDVMAGTENTIIIVLTDNQDTPHATTFTFTDALLTRSVKRIPELRLSVEQLEWSGGKLTIS